MEPAHKVMGAIDDYQRRNRWAGVPYAVVKKFGNDNANMVAVALAWYGFTAIFPLLLVVVTAFHLIGAGSLGEGLLRTLQEFPVIGSSFTPESDSKLHGGSIVGLIVGLVGLLYGAQGVTQTAQLAMAQVWNIPQIDRTGYVGRLGRSYGALFLIGLAFVLNSFVTGYATGGTHSYAIRIPIIAGLVILNSGFYFGVFTLLTARVIGPRGLLPGAVAGGVIFTALITVGTGLVTHQLKNTSATYGAFGTVIGIVAFLLLLAKLSMYAAELNPVLSRRLYPRALPFGGDPTDADHEVLRDLVLAEKRREDQVIDVAFGEGHATGQGATGPGDAGAAPERDDATPGPDATPGQDSSGVPRQNGPAGAEPEHEHERADAAGQGRLRSLVRLGRHR
ncbi:MAG TPA: YihY/virulence factor BrkB family protein [Trebonia sp.]|nr:YihY/virulence factor BrkB family protein [Trebonia sp.]